MRVLVIGSSGMIGSSVLRVLNDKKDWRVFGTVRDESVKKFFTASIGERLEAGVDVENTDSLVRVLDRIRPEIVINCAGITKHKPSAEETLISVPINSLIPHKLAALCKLINSRLIHISTDCVFSGEKGNYIETDFPDARDVYGKSKILGEVDYPHAITLRTSTIGHELDTRFGLLEWFLLQQDRCKGYTRAIFSGLPTIILAEIIRDVVIPNSGLSGLYHIAAKPINKFDLLKLVSEVYEKDIEIVPDSNLVIDRSLSATKFRLATGYEAPEWSELIKLMHAYK